MARVVYFSQNDVVWGMLIKTNKKSESESRHD